MFEEVWHATVERMEKRKDANVVYSAWACVRQCDGVLREVQNSNKTLRAKIRELKGNLEIEVDVGEGVGTMGQESPGPRTTTL